MDYSFPIDKEGVKKLIPQRDPFLFIDKVISCGETSIKTVLKLGGNESFFKGHFPDNPIMPGVLLQEAIFQSGAAYIGLKNDPSSDKPKLGVVARVKNAKFKNMVTPGDELEMVVSLEEAIGNAFYMKGITKVKGKTVLSIEFTCAIV